MVNLDWIDWMDGLGSLNELNGLIIIAKSEIPPYWSSRIAAFEEEKERQQHLSSSRLHDDGDGDHKLLVKIGELLLSVADSLNAR